MERDNQFNEASTERRNSDSAVSQGVFDELMAFRNENLKDQTQSYVGFREVQPTEIVFNSQGKDHVLTQTARADEKATTAPQKKIEDQVKDLANSGRLLSPVEIVFNCDGKDHVLTQSKRNSQPRTEENKDNGTAERPDRRDENTRPTGPANSKESAGKDNSSSEKSPEKTENQRSEFVEKVKEATEKRNRQIYENAASKLIDAASMSPTVQKGEGYYQVLKRMYPSMNESDLVDLAADTKKLNGGRQLHTGEHFQVLDKEQKLRLRDQVMNDYDARHKTDALDVYGDFAPEKGPMASVHNAMRKDLSGRIENNLKQLDPIIPPTTVEPPSPTPQAPPKAAMTAAEFGKEAMMAFPKLDLDHNGFVDKQELGLAEQNKNLTDSEREIAATMGELESPLSKLSDDQPGSEKSISLLDLSRFEQIEEKVARQQEELAKLNNAFANPQLFEMIDQNGDRRLSKSELKNAMLQGNLAPADTDSVNFLIENYAAAEKSVNDEFGPENSGVSYGDLRFMSSKASQSKDNKLVNAVQSGLKIAHEKNLQQAPAKESTPA